jgi:hypothetical protein
MSKHFNKGDKVTAVHPVSGKWEEATALSGPQKSSLNKDWEWIVQVRFTRDRYTCQSPTIYTEKS